MSVQERGSPGSQGSPQAPDSPSPAWWHRICATAQKQNATGTPKWLTAIEVTHNLPKGLDM